MKMIKIITCCLLMFSCPYVKAQKIQLDTYHFEEGLTFSDSKGNMMNLTGYVQPYFETRYLTGADGVDPLNRFRIRRLRFRVSGLSENQKLSYRLQFDLSGSSEVDESSASYLMDAYVGYELTSRIKAYFGQRATYTDNRELFMASNTLQLVERSRLTSAFASIREFGLFLQGNFRTGGGTYLKPYFTLTNGDGINVFNKDHGGLKIGGRLDFLPLGLFTNFGQFRQADIMRENTPKLVIGAVYSYNSGISSRRGRESGSILYLDDSGNESLPDYMKYGADFLFKYRGFSMIGEFVKTKSNVPDDIRQRVRTDGSVSTSFLIDGIQNVENYIKNRMMLGEGYNIQAGYLFKSGISVDSRYTHLKADKYSFLNNGTFHNRPNYYTLGISKYAARNYGSKIQLSVTYVDANEGINDNNGDPVSGNEWIGRLILTVSF